MHTLLEKNAQRNRKGVQGLLVRMQIYDRENVVCPLFHAS